MGVAPIYLAVFRTACWPYWREEMSYTSAGFSMAAMAMAASRSSSYVLYHLMLAGVWSMLSPCRPEMGTMATAADGLKEQATLRC